jgi:ATP-dependent RNA helicase DeaD
VSAADGTHEGDPTAVPTRHADFTNWQPPAEEGDDEPILGQGGERIERPSRGERRRERGPEAAPREEARVTMGDPERVPQTSATTAENDADFAEIYVNVGRREGARAADFQRILTERAGIDKAFVRRIRVRERNAFVSVRKDDLAKAIEALTGATIAGKVAAAEQARERGAEGEGAPEAARTVAEESAPTAEAPAAPAEAPAGEEAVNSDAVPTGRQG